MSISYCNWCRRIIEGRVVEDNTGIDVCPDCGEQSEELPEDDPKEDR